MRTLVTTEGLQGSFCTFFIAVGQILVVVQGIHVGSREWAEIALEALDCVFA